MIVDLTFGPLDGRRAVITKEPPAVLYLSSREGVALYRRVEESSTYRFEQIV